MTSVTPDHHRPPKPQLHKGALLIQVAAVLAVFAVAALIAISTAYNLEARGIRLGLDFLVQRAGFSVAETLVPFDPAHSVLRAMWVGVSNTLFVSAIVAAASTVLGVLVGIGRLSPNPMLAGLARVWVESVRNTPPVLLLIFIYSLWWQVAPSDRALTLGPGILVSIRGLALPALSLNLAAVDLAMIAGAIALCVLAISGALKRFSGSRGPFVKLAAVAILLALCGALGASGRLGLSLPHAEGADLRGGATLTPELFTILFGLTLYTTGFVAEVVRGGIEAVPKGQWEAARAVGLTEPAVLRFVILPQMLRVIIPPMTSQYVNIVKNSTLALAVGYTDFLTIMGTVINKTGHAVEGTVLIVLVYLAINLTVASWLNIYNARLAKQGGR